MKNNSRGFTLTEVLLVATMFAVISLAVFNAFANGFKLWARGQHVMAEGNIAVFLDKIAQDLRSTVSISGISFKGSTTELSFPAIILAPTDAHGSRAAEEMGTQIGAVRYRFDAAAKKIYRSQAVYGQALKQAWFAPVEVASGVEDIALHYYVSGDKHLDVKDQNDQGIPVGVIIDVQLMINDQICHWRRFVAIPVGGGV